MCWEGRSVTERMTPVPAELGPQVITFGCRLNHAESDVMLAHAKAAGLNNAIVVNTCAVTAEAQRQAKQAIRRVRRENPDSLIVVTGCGVQVAPDGFVDMPEIDRLLGNQEKLDPQFWVPQMSDRVVISDIQTVREVAPHLVSAFQGQIRAFVQIQNGCDHACTFCIIPQGRGPNRSVPMGELVRVTSALLAGGTREVVLTGVDLTAYGEDLPGNPTLGRMLRRLLNHVPSLTRLRLSSLDPAELDDDFFEVIQDPRILPHFHISLQAADDLILRRMRRRHLRHHLISFCDRLRALRPDAVLGADVIAGFPTETDAFFEQTRSFLEDYRIPFLHVFPFSPRPGTPAARMPQVPGPVIKERAAVLRALGDRLKEEMFRGLVGTTQPVLLENPRFGHTETFVPVFFDSPCPQEAVGQVIQVPIAGVKEGVRGVFSGGVS